MKILKMNASFGKLDADTLELSPGLNIIQAPNESGKSTWCGFINTMLYGINTAERDKANQLSAKTKFQPWSGKPMEGTMELESGGKDITLKRSSFAKSPMRNLSAVYTDTDTSVEGLTGQNPGKVLTGMEQDVFERTAFIAQHSVRVNQTQELEKKLMSIVSSGDEDTSYTDVSARLNNWRRRIEYRDKGLLAKAKSEYAAVKSDLDKINSLGDEISQLQSRESKEAAEERLLQREVKAIEDGKLRDKIIRTQQYKDVYDAVHDRCDKLEADITVNGHIPTKKEIDLLREQYSDFSVLAKQKDEANARLEKTPLPPVTPKTPTTNLIPAIIMAFLALAAAAASLVFENLKMPMIICAGVLVLAAAVTAVIIVRAYRKSAHDSAQIMMKEHNAAQSEAEDAQKRYQQKKDDIIARASRLGIYGELVSGMDTLNAKLEEYEKAKNDTAVAKQVWQMWSQENEISPDNLPDIQLVPRYDLQQTQRRLESAAQSRQLLRTQIDRAMMQLNMLGDISSLTEKKQQLAAKIDALESTRDAIDTAIKALNEANEDMQRRFSPAISKCAGQILSSMTGGKYTSVTFDRDMSASAKARDEIISHSFLTLSSGTVQQVYLALRIAMCLMMPSEAEPCPIILDDVLADFDDERAMQTLNYLYELSQIRQVIIFTCHNREAMFIGGRDGVKVTKL